MTKSELSRPMASFSNTNDGLLIVGVDDKTRKIRGAKTTRQREECPENIYIVRNKQRNPNIAGILTGYGYAEQIGEGMQLFKRECDRHPLKPKYPEYREWIDTTVTVLYPAEVGV